jgi:hypothetical protein
LIQVHSSKFTVGRNKEVKRFTVHGSRLEEVKRLRGLRSRSSQFKVHSWKKGGKRRKMSEVRKMKRKNDSPQRRRGRPASLRSFRRRPVGLCRDKSPRLAEKK